MKPAGGSAIGRILELFEGPEAPGPWTPPAMPAALHALLPWRAWDETSELYVNAASIGFVVELPPFAGIDAEALGALAGTLADAAPERCTIQVIHWASPRFGAASRAWAEPRAGAGGALARMGARRSDLLSPGGWRRLHAGGPPFTPLGLPGVRDRLPRRCARPGPGDRARRVPPGARRHPRLGGRRHPPAGAGRTAVAGGRADRARCFRFSRRRNGAPRPALVAARSDPRAVRRARPRAHRGAHRPHLPPSRWRGHRGCGFSRRSPSPRSGPVGAAMR